MEDNKFKPFPGKESFPDKTDNFIKINTLQYIGEMVFFSNPIKCLFARKAFIMNSGLRSLLEPHKVQFLKKKLQQGEISVEECKEIMKRLILQKYNRIQNRSFRASILGFGRSLESKLTVKA